MNKEVLQAKQNTVSEIVSGINSNQATVICEYRALSVAKLQELRRALRAEGASLVVYKNSLVERAVDEIGHPEVKEILVGPNAVIFSEDAFKGPKVIAKYARRFGDSFSIKGALIEGHYVTPDVVKQFAKLPGREGLLSMFLSVLQAPVRQFACAVKAVADAK